MGYYTLKCPFTQGGALSFFPSVVLHQEDSIFLRCVGSCPAQRFCFSLDPGGAQAPPEDGWKTQKKEVFFATRSLPSGADITL